MISRVVIVHFLFFVHPSCGFLLTYHQQKLDNYRVRKDLANACSYLLIVPTHGIQIFKLDYLKDQEKLDIISRLKKSYYGDEKWQDLYVGGQMKKRKRIKYQRVTSFSLYRCQNFEFYGITSFYRSLIQVLFVSGV